MTLKLVRPEPKEREDVHLHFSFSQLNTYLICPFKFKFQYVEGVPWETKPVALPFGKAIHKSAETYYRNLQETGEIVPIDQLISTFETVFDQDIQNSDTEISYKEGETFQSVRDQGISLVKIFHAEVKPQNIRAIELPFTVTVPDILNGNGDLPVRLKGIFDLIESDRDGSYAVVELKTSKQRFSSLRLQYDNQPTVYSYAMKKIRVATSDNSCLVRYDVLLKTKKPGFEQYFVSRDESDFQRLIHLINYVLKAIENRIFYRQTGWQCEDCQFKKVCFS